MVTVGVIYDHPRWEEKAIINALKMLGAGVELIHAESTPLEVGSPCCRIDVAIQRSVSFSTALSTTFTIESWGVEVLNPGSVTYIAGDKIATLSILARNSIPTPSTIVSVGRSGLNGRMPPGPPWVLKPVIGSWGRYIAKARDIEELNQLLEYKEGFKGLFTRIHLIQEYIRKPGRDIRVFTLGDQVLTGIYRVSDNWITNTSRGGIAKPVDMTPELEELAVKASRALGGGFLGIDIFEDPNRGYLVNEVNAVPEFRNTVRVTGRRIELDVARHLINLAKR